MQMREPAACRVIVDHGLLTNSTGRFVKRLSDLEGLYADQAAFRLDNDRDGERIVYEVTEFRPSSDRGNLIFGVTRLAAGKVGQEFYMTRGHIHRNATRPEIYYGEAGRGLVLLESPQGDVRTLEIAPRVICYVPPYWIHRSVNTGPDDLVMTFAYPADAGQDYEIITRSGGMRQRIVDDGQGGWIGVENENYRPRNAAQVDEIFQARA